jgi:hypothetical protein
MPVTLQKRTGDGKGKGENKKIRLAMLTEH